MPEFVAGIICALKANETTCRRAPAGDGVPFCCMVCNGRSFVREERPIYILSPKFKISLDDSAEIWFREAEEGPKERSRRCKLRKVNRRVQIGGEFGLMIGGKRGVALFEDHCFALWLSSDVELIASDSVKKGQDGPGCVPN